MLKRIPIFAFTLTAACAAIAHAQDSAEAEVRAAIQQLFDGMRAGDSAMVRRVLVDDVRMSRAMERDGVPALRSGSAEGWLNAIGTPHDEVWDEQIWDLDIQVDGRLATAWMKFAFFRGETFSHCGVNAMMLFKDTDGWKVFSLADTSRQTNCWMPPGRHEGQHPT